MMLIGVDYHPSFQTIAFLVEETGECGEQELNQARKSYWTGRSRSHWFDPVSETSELPDHLRCAVLYRPLAYCGAAFLVTDFLVQNLPDQPT